VRSWPIATGSIETRVFGRGGRHDRGRTSSAAPFIYGLLRGDPPADLLRFANAAAAVSVTRQGAIDSVPTLADIEILLKETNENTT
jgi:hypothetical protein